jgi:hypothetical protein
VSAFIAMFRRAVGMTPTAYLNGLVTPSISAGERVPARRLNTDIAMGERLP